MAEVRTCQLTDLVALCHELVPEGCFKLPKRPVCGLPALSLHRILRINTYQEKKRANKKHHDSHVRAQPGQTEGWTMKIYYADIGRIGDRHKKKNTSRLTFMVRYSTYIQILQYSTYKKTNPDHHEAKGILNKLWVAQAVFRVLTFHLVSSAHTRGGGHTAHDAQNTRDSPSSLGRD